MYVCMYVCRYQALDRHANVESSWQSGAPTVPMEQWLPMSVAPEPREDGFGIGMPYEVSTSADKASANRDCRSIFKQSYEIVPPAWRRLSDPSTDSNNGHATDADDCDGTTDPFRYDTDVRREMLLI